MADDPFNRLVAALPGALQNRAGLCRLSARGGMLAFA